MCKGRKWYGNLIKERSNQNWTLVSWQNKQRYVQEVKLYHVIIICYHTDVESKVSNLDYFLKINRRRLQKQAALLASFTLTNAAGDSRSTKLHAMCKYLFLWSSKYLISTSIGFLRNQFLKISNGIIFFLWFLKTRFPVS
jgi:hypothetical protein